MKRPAAIPSVTKSANHANPMKDIIWRLERLERQVQKLSELVRDHAEDNDRLVRIVAEDRDVIRRSLLRKHEHKVRVRRHLRDVSWKSGAET
jgi:polyhydroxyalkanoate synthesis regulator phasin